MKKKILSFGSLIVSAVMCFTFAGCTAKNGEDGAVSFVGLDINPSIEITLDRKDRVVSVYGANEDGKVLLYGEEGIVGESVEDAVGKITVLAVELGYLDENNAAVETSVSTTGKSGEELLKKVNAKISSSAELFDLEVDCKSEGTYSLKRKLEDLKEAYPDSAAIQSLTIAKFKLVSSAAGTGVVTVEEAAEMSNKELIKLISEAHSSSEGYETEDYNEEVSLARAAYDEAYGEALDGIYLSYYMSHHRSRYYYAALYKAYRSSARRLNAIADSFGYARNVSKIALTDEQTAVILEVLGLDDADVLRNSDGNVTIKSAEEYADKFFKNQKGTETKETERSLTDAIHGIEAELRESLGEVSSVYKSQIAAVTGVIMSVVQPFKGMLHNPTIPEDARALIVECAEIVEELKALTADGDLTTEEIRLLAAELGERAQAVLDIMQSDLSAEELAEIETLQEKAIEGISAARENYERAIEEAIAHARRHLEERKAARYRR